ncbi:hypothetical protein [Gemmata sp.]
MSTPPVTLPFKPHARGNRWRVIGTAAGYLAAIELGERADLGPGR